jgi:hypothetical protein
VISTPHLRLALVAVLALSVASCHSGSSSDDAGKQPQPTPDQSRANVVAALRDTWRALAPVGVTAPNGASGRWASCQDNGGAVLYKANLRVDPESAGDPPLAGRIETVPATAGWDLEPQSRADGAGSTRHGAKGDLTIAISTYPGTEASYALIEIIGPCLSVGSADQTYTNRGSEALSVG